MNINLKKFSKIYFYDPNKNKHKKFLKSGFSLVELIVVLAIMAVMLAVLAPALMGYTERSRASKDKSTMSEVTSAIQLAMADQDIYDELSGYSRYGNVSCYIDSNTEAVYQARAKSNEKTVSPYADNTTVGEYAFDDSARLLDESQYYAAGNMRGLTITFEPKSGENNHTEYELKDAVINKFVNNGVEHKVGNASPLLYARLKSVIAEIVEQDSQTYRNSEYTVFIRLGSTQKAVKIYGQYDGTNLPLRTNPNTNVTIDRKPTENPNPIVPPNPNPNPGGGSGGGSVTPPVTPPTDPPHTHSYVEKHVAPTCTTGGWTEHTCSCGDSYQDNKVAALGHNMTEQSKTESTCTVKGAVTKQCSRCDFNETTELPLAEHKYKDSIHQPSCTTDGWTDSICSVCKNKITKNYVNKLGHNYKHIVVPGKTCTAPGTEYDQCTRCQAKQNERPTSGGVHDIKTVIEVQATCTQKGLIRKICSKCNFEEMQEQAMLAHQYQNGRVHAPTCTEKGWTDASCVMCGHSVKKNETQALGHQMIEKTESATCEKTGRVYRECQRTGCSHTQLINTIPLRPHTEATRVVSQATWDTPGRTDRYCTVCGVLLGTITTPAIKAQPAYVFYSQTDKSLNFIRSATEPRIGDTYQNKVISNLYFDVETAGQAPWLDAPWTLDCKRIEFFDQIRPYSTSAWFKNMRHVISMRGFEKLNTSLTNNMSYMFEEFGVEPLGSVVLNVDVSHLDTSNVKNFYAMFLNVKWNTINVSGFNTAQAENMGRMFSGCNNVTTLDVGHFDMSHVLSTYEMFDLCKSLKNIDVSAWNAPKLSNMSGMFKNCTGLTTIDLSKLTLPKVNNVTELFAGANHLVSIKMFDFVKTQNIFTDFSRMFDGCGLLETVDLNNMAQRMGNVTRFTSMFNECYMLRTINSGSIGMSFDLRNAEDTTEMFNKCEALSTINIAHFGKSASAGKLDMTRMFSGCESLSRINLQTNAGVGYDVSTEITGSDVFKECYVLKNRNNIGPKPQDYSWNSATNDFMFATTYDNGGYFY